MLYAMNGISVTSPDEEVWTPVAIGTDLSGEQKRSGYYSLEWRKSVVDPCRLDWFDYDNTTLTMLRTRAPDELDEWTTYTDVVCKNVSMRQVRQVGNEVIAVFTVYVG